MNTHPSFTLELTVSSPPTIEAKWENDFRAVARQTKLFSSAESIAEAEGSAFSFADSTPACFPGHAKVKLANGFQVPISAIALGDEVEIEENVYSPC